MLGSGRGAFPPRRHCRRMAVSLWQRARPRVLWFPRVLRVLRVLRELRAPLAIRVRPPRLQRLRLRLHGRSPWSPHSTR
jgi:hypothetical protein